MIAKYNRKSLMFGAPGITLQIGSYIALESSWSAVSPVILSLSLLTGTGLLLVGIAYYAKAKGQHPALCVLGLLSIIGLVVLSTLPDLTEES